MAKELMFEVCRSTSLRWYDFSNVDIQDLEYLIYGRFYLPTGRLDALYSTRISPTLQVLVAGISDPRSKIDVDRRSRVDNVSNVMVSLQHDVGKWCTEYTWSAEDAMWGVRVLHNFGRVGPSIDGPLEDSLQVDGKPTRLKRVDEEDAVSGGLKGRVSAGAEAYFSAKEKSAGGKQHHSGHPTRVFNVSFAVSTGIRFTTLPDATPPSFQLPGNSSSPLYNTSSGRGLPSPPTTITALFNPMLGHISGAYAARVSRDLALCSRFDFNVYSYESEWTMGAEWWMRRRPSTSRQEVDEVAPMPLVVPPEPWEDVRGVVKARASTNNVSPRSCNVCHSV